MSRPAACDTVLRGVPFCTQVGSPFAGRVHPATRRMVGCCVNTLPLRARLNGLATLAELLRQVRGTALAAYANADAPLHSVMAALGRSHAQPLFQVRLFCLGGCSLSLLCFAEISMPALTLCVSNRANTGGIG